MIRFLRLIKGVYWDFVAKLYNKTLDILALVLLKRTAILVKG